MLGIEFDNDFASQTGNGRRNTDTGGQDNLSILGNVGGLDDGDIDTAPEAIADFLGEMGQMKVDIGGGTVVDTVAQVFVRLIGRTELDGIGTGQHTVQGITGGSSCKDTDFEFTAGFVFGHGLGRNRSGYHLGGTGRGKSAESDIVAILDDGRSLFCRNKFQ